MSAPNAHSDFDRAGRSSLWAIAAGVAAASTWFVIGLGSLALAGLAIGLGGVEIRAGRRALGVVAILLGLVPVSWFIFYYLALVFDWGDVGR